ncbi:hypothetical protein LTR53_002565 [Teratosphaeriaceae sp. CCFEE 6253]|nr:hypothetical protein LTR53_002565 [Teratosphaeriaceae sp. CCFEE 6253]
MVRLERHSALGRHQLIVGHRISPRDYPSIKRVQPIWTVHEAVSVDTKDEVTQCIVTQHRRTHDRAPMLMSNSMSVVPQPQDDRTYSFADRTFAQFSLQHDVHCIPVDQDEIVLLQPGQFPPRGVDKPEVLECGFGKGAWIDEFLERYHSWVTGVDIYLGEDNDGDDGDDDDDDDSPVQEFERKRWNLNAPFREDRSATRLSPEQFHLINSRFLADGINADRWPSYIRELKRMLIPGGWLQMVELELRFQSDNGRLASDNSAPLYVWSECYRRLMIQRNRDPRVGSRLRQYLEAEGFEQVYHGMPRLAIGGWSSDPGLGHDVRANMHGTLETVLLWPCIGALPGRGPPAMSTEQYRAMVRGAQAQLQDESLKLYYTACVSDAVCPPSDPQLTRRDRHVVRGRRPLASRRR